MIYEPREDSFLLVRAARKALLDSGCVSALDMGCGSGIVTQELVLHVKDVVGADISPHAVEYCRTHVLGSGGHTVRFVQSDLFQKIRGKFDLITFNPPYLPDDPEFNDPALHGGPLGCEVIRRFLRAAPSHLSKHGRILLLLSSVNDPPNLQKEFASYSWKCVAKESLFFEALSVFELS